MASTAPVYLITRVTDLLTEGASRMQSPNAPSPTLPRYEEHAPLPPIPRSVARAQQVLHDRGAINAAHHAPVTIKKTLAEM